MTAFLQGPGPIAFAHRGGALEAPENSRAAVEHVVALGLSYLETDVRATSDGVAVLFHDPTVDRATNGTGRIDTMTAARLAHLRDHSGGSPLRLDELLGDHPDLRLNIDAKDDHAVEPLVRTLRAAKALDRVGLASFSDARLARLREMLPGVATSLGRGEVVRLMAAAHGFGPVVGMRRRPLPGPADGVVAAQVPARLRGRRFVTPRLVSAAHRLGLGVHVWTVNEPDEMVRLLDLGVDGLISDRPTVLRDVLTARGPWH
ncbi:MAG: glycerophosphodiester phosphodiesterase [Georgenia sp.]